VAKSGSKKPPDKEHDNQRVIIKNRKANFNYDILDELECGVVLHGSEVKSLRHNRCSLEEAYGRVREGEVWLVGCDIPEYKEASIFNHAPRRPRKLLLHRREIRNFASKAYQQGFTLVPLELYFKDGKVKLRLGLCKGRKTHDKRQVLKKREAARDISRALRRRV